MVVVTLLIWIPYLLLWLPHLARNSYHIVTTGLKPAYYGFLLHSTVLFIIIVMATIAETDSFFTHIHSNDMVCRVYGAVFATWSVIEMNLTTWFGYFKIIFHLVNPEINHRILLKR
eukprot:UN10776